ncbi:hypothetical protein, partial [Pleionea sp. CnH1-48]|uniref:hypothetical protein n=1 Tax=Pleionea sp. CnH1-48 TaxID=2954494 RepID=UPI0020979175
LTQTGRSVISAGAAHFVIKNTYQAGQWQNRQVLANAFGSALGNAIVEDRIHHAEAAIATKKAYENNQRLLDQTQIAQTHADINEVANSIAEASQSNIAGGLSDDMSQVAAAGEAATAERRQEQIAARTKAENTYGAQAEQLANERSAQQADLERRQRLMAERTSNRPPVEFWNDGMRHQMAHEELVRNTAHLSPYSFATDGGNVPFFLSQTVVEQMPRVATPETGFKVDASQLVDFTSAALKSAGGLLGEAKQYFLESAMNYRTNEGGVIGHSKAARNEIWAAGVSLLDGGLGLLDMTLQANAVFYGTAIEDTLGVSVFSDLTQRQDRLFSGTEQVLEMAKYHYGELLFNRDYRSELGTEGANFIYDFATGDVKAAQKVVMGSTEALLGAIPFSKVSRLSRAAGSDGVDFSKLTLTPADKINYNGVGLVGKAEGSGYHIGAAWDAPTNTKWNPSAKSQNCVACVSSYITDKTNMPFRTADDVERIIASVDPSRNLQLVEATKIIRKATGADNTFVKSPFFADAPEGHYAMFIGPAKDKLAHVFHAEKLADGGGVRMFDPQNGQVVNVEDLVSLRLKWGGRADATIVPMFIKPNSIGAQ